MKNLATKYLPLIQKLIGKKPIVVVLSILVIGGYVYAVQKGYIQEGSFSIESMLNAIDSTFQTPTVDTLPVQDTLQSIK